MFSYDTRQEIVCTAVVPLALIVMHIHDLGGRYILPLFSGLIETFDDFRSDNLGVYVEIRTDLVAVQTF